MQPDFIVNSENPVYVVFGDHTRSFNIATESFCVADNVKILSINKQISIRSLLYIVSSWKKCVLEKGYARHWSIAKEVLFSLPTLNGVIDFDFMDRFVAELEAERVAELEAYLSATGLRDYTLTSAEEQVVKDFESGKFEWGEFKIEDILQWQPQKEIDPLKLEILKDRSEEFYPFYGQSTTNNGIISHNQLTKEVLNNKDAKPTILIHSNNQNIVYLETPFYLKDGHGATSVLQSEHLNKTNQMCIIASIDKVIKMKYSYNAKATKIELKNTIIEIPTLNSQPDYTLMETFVSAIQKLVIRDVILYADRKIEATQTIIAR